MKEIPHKCKVCNKQLYLETRKYNKGFYFCKECVFKKAKVIKK